MTDTEQTEAAAQPEDPKSEAPKVEETPKTQFAPRVEAEEGEPTRFDYAVLVLVTVLIVGALLWAFGFITIPGLPI